MCESKSKKVKWWGRRDVFDETRWVQGRFGDWVID